MKKIALIPLIVLIRHRRPGWLVLRKCCRYPGKTGRPGVDAEYKWIREHYPGSKTGSQALVFKNGKPYDISNYFGKF